MHKWVNGQTARQVDEGHTTREMDNQHLSSIYHVPGTVLSHILSHLRLTPTLGWEVGGYYHPHFKDEKTEVDITSNRGGI